MFEARIGQIDDALARLAQGGYRIAGAGARTVTGARPQSADRAAVSHRPRPAYP